MTIDYESLKKEVIEFLDDHKILVFATCAENRVTARAMSCVYKGLTIYFQTGTTSVKFKQLARIPMSRYVLPMSNLKGCQDSKTPLDSRMLNLRSV